MDKIKLFIKNKKRLMIQLCAALVYNLNLRGFVTGKISAAVSKSVCVPGLNCYSCPGAIGACPLGALQSSLGALKNKLPLYIVGTLLLFGIALGRAVCGFLCPIGLIQELLYKIPTKKLRKSKTTRTLSILKYIILAVFVFALPIYYLLSEGVAIPAFCKFICPAGTLQGGVPLLLLDEQLRSLPGGLFFWKLSLLILFIVCSVFIFRVFCRFICPLGAIYSLFNKVAVVGVHVDEHKCTGCGRCARFCKMDVKQVNDLECIRCGECAKVCPTGAITNGFDFIAKEDKIERN